MNKWLYRAVGTAGVAGGFLLLGSAAHADDTTRPAAEPIFDAATTAPQQLTGLLDELFTPLGDNAGLGLGGLLAGDGANLGGGDGKDQVSAPDGVTADDILSQLPLLSQVGGPSAGITTESVSPIEADGGFWLPSLPLLDQGGGVSAGNGLPVNGTDLLGSVTTILRLPTMAHADKLLTDGDQLVPALIGEELTAQHPELFTAEALPLLGDLPVVGGIVQNASGNLGGLPLVGDLGLLGGGGAADGLLGLSGNTLGAERPVADGESARAEVLDGLPILGSLLPLSNEPSTAVTLPIVGQLPTPLQALSELPLLGALA